MCACVDVMLVLCWDCVGGVWWRLGVMSGLCWGYVDVVLELCWGCVVVVL